MLSKDVTVINGMVRTKDSIKMKDKIVNYRGQMIDVGAGSMGDWSSICSIPGNPTNPIGAWGKTEQEAIENIKPKIDKVLSNKTKDEGKYKIYWINHNYYSQEEFNTLEEARKYADSKSFEYRIDLNGKPVASGGALRGFRMMDKKTKDDMAVGNIKEIDYKGYQIQLRRYENYVGWKILKNGSLISNGQNFYSENRAVEEAKKDIDKLTNKMKDAMTESQVKASCKQAGREFLADKTKDDWSPEARAKALEARRAHKKAQPDQPPQRRQPTKLNSQEKEWYRAAKQNLEEAKRNGDAEKAKKLETEIKQFEKEYL